jgi:hypothetical protein
MHASTPTSTGDASSAVVVHASAMPAAPSAKLPNARSSRWRSRTVAGADPRTAAGAPPAAMAGRGEDEGSILQAIDRCAPVLTVRVTIPPPDRHHSRLVLSHPFAQAARMRLALELYADRLLRHAERLRDDVDGARTRIAWAELEARVRDRLGGADCAVLDALGVFTGADAAAERRLVERRLRQIRVLERLQALVEQELARADRAEGDA